MFRRPKGKGKRAITLPKPLVALLRQHKIRQDAERDDLGDLWQDNDLVFCSPTGGPVDPRDDWEDWHELLRRAGVRRVRLHDGRHTAGTLLIEQGCPHPGGSADPWACRRPYDTGIRCRRDGARRSRPDGLRAVIGGGRRPRTQLTVLSGR